MIKQEHKFEFVMERSALTQLRQSIGNDLFLEALINDVDTDHYDGKTVLGFKTDFGVKEIPYEVVIAVLDLGGDINSSNGVWIEIDTAELDKEVDSQWPEAYETSTDEDGNKINGSLRILRNYTAIKEGTKGKSLVNCGWKDYGDSSFDSADIETPYAISLYRTKFPEGKLYYQNLLKDWENENQEGGN